MLMGLAVYAFAASNTIPGSRAGSGASVVSGYTVTNVAYNLNSSNPRNIDSVTFTLDAAAASVRVKLESASTTFYSCSNAGGLNWSCATISPQAAVLAADELTVIATS
jgi:archaellin